MLFTHEQMKKKFGTAFIINILSGNKIEERYRTSYSPYEFFDTPEQAKYKAISYENEKLLKEQQRVKQVLEKYDTLPFMKKIYSFIFNNGHKAHRLAKEFLEEKKNQTLLSISFIENSKVVMLPEDKTYKVEYENLNVGDDIYLVVENKNLLDAGFYHGKLKEVKHDIFNNNEVRFSGVFVIDIEGNEKEFALTVNSDGKLNHAYSYHTVFTDEKEAKDFSNKVMKEKSDFYASKIQK